MQKAADIAVKADSRFSTNAASGCRLLTGYDHDSVKPTKKEYTREDMYANRAECLFSLLKPYLRVFRGISKINLLGYMDFFQFLLTFPQLTAFEQAELILHAALDPFVANRARKGEFIKRLDHVNLLQNPTN